MFYSAAVIHGLTAVLCHCRNSYLNDLLKMLFKLEDVDDIYYEKNYYAISEKHAEKAYELLYEAMRKLGVTEITKTVIGTKRRCRHSVSRMMDCW